MERESCSVCTRTVIYLKIYVIKDAQQAAHISLAYFVNNCDEYLVNENVLICGETVYCGLLLESLRKNALELCVLIIEN